MDWKAHSNEEDPPDRPKKGWRFSFWGGSEVTAENGIPSAQPGDTYPLSLATPDKTLWIAGFQGKGGINRLLGMGLAPGISLTVINSQPSGSVLVAIGDNRIALGAEIAGCILVSDRSPNPAAEVRTYLRDMLPGTDGYVVGYDKVMRGYKGKLLSMGLTPGTRFTVIRVAPLGDPIEIQVRGFHLSLRKQEADALVVEEINAETES
jgi:ferrous iron transport protein A